MCRHTVVRWTPRISAARPTRPVHVLPEEVDGWFEDDAVYNVGGGVLRAPAAGVDDTYVGSELDLSVVWNLDRHWKVTGGWCWFWAGDFIEATGPSDDVSFFWLDTQVTF
jgi:hypothetical protein